MAEPENKTEPQPLPGLDEDDWIEPPDDEWAEEMVEAELARLRAQPLAQPVPSCQEQAKPADTAWDQRRRERARERQAAEDRLPRCERCGKHPRLAKLGICRRCLAKERAPRPTEMPAPLRGDRAYLALLQASGKRFEDVPGLK